MSYSESESEHIASSQPAEHVAHIAHKAKPKSEPAEVYRVALRLPPFWPEEPDIWFAQIEAMFEYAGVTNDFTKYNYVVGHLDLQFLKEVKDIIMSPRAINRYEKLKTELLRRLSASQERKVKQQLMYKEELGDQKPSQFLRHLQRLAGPTVPEDIVRTIWCSRLPASIQPFLASQPHSTLEALAELADRVQDIVAPASQVVATSVAGPSVSEMAAEIAELRHAMRYLAQQLRELRSGNRSRSRDRDTKQNSCYHPSARTELSYQQNPVCSYHLSYGEKAKRCMRPCDFWQGNAAGSQ